MQSNQENASKLSSLVVPVYATRKRGDASEYCGCGFFVAPRHFLTACELARDKEKPLHFLDPRLDQMCKARVTAMRWGANLALAEVIDEEYPGFPDTLPVARRHPRTVCPVLLIAFAFSKFNGPSMSILTGDFHPLHTRCPCGDKRCFYSEGGFQVHLQGDSALSASNFVGAPVINATTLEAIGMTSSFELGCSHADTRHFIPARAVLCSQLPSMRQFLACQAYIHRPRTPTSET